MLNYILQIDTATDKCSVSISANGTTIGLREAEEPNMHASMLTVYIDELLSSLSLLYSDLVAVAVSKGPGSYTGLRIGVSTAKGLCYALDIPLIAINTLDSMFSGYVSTHGLIQAARYIPMLDARRMEVYAKVFAGNEALLQDTAAIIIDEHTFQAYSPADVYLFGSGAAKLSSLFQQQPQIHIDATFAQSSGFLSKLAWRKFTEKDFEDLIYFEPYYLKEFVATQPKKILGK
ncbi:tRNA (adenosine(37)-N6)-threonylcarbamoyltransferase complex dimerization subunit type 1 TsaB [Sphingobacterium sp. Mn56C]|uniref:tRNA (adenosine(37)-N6)-threonylcarbamoyltransferase complex dimerization subunit type 1 TsaB n=1 Tax=Sphingobacterium sp. Mn56C TaxID=3395261 RepID=UPI003BC0749D